MPINVIFFFLLSWFGNKKKRKKEELFITVTELLQLCNKYPENYGDTEEAGGFSLQNKMTRGVALRVSGAHFDSIL